MCTAAKLLPKDGARWIASNIAKLLESVANAGLGLFFWGIWLGPGARVLSDRARHASHKEKRHEAIHSRARSCCFCYGHQRSGIRKPELRPQFASLHDPPHVLHMWKIGSDETFVIVCSPNCCGSSDSIPVAFGTIPKRRQYVIERAASALRFGSKADIGPKLPQIDENYVPAPGMKQRIRVLP
jgi:hypothetical protein